MTNTLARHLEILTTARAAITAAGGVAALDALPQAERHPALLRLYHQVAKETGCHHTTAKSNVAKAMRKARYALMVEAGNAPAPIEKQWGGAHGGPVGWQKGRKRKQKQANNPLT